MTDNKDKQLNKLLRLKKFEMPSEERWSEFDRAFENRRLAALKDSKIRTVFSSVVAIFNFRRIVCSSALLLLLLVCSVIFTRNRPGANNLDAVWEDGQKYVQFASDRMLTSGDDIDTKSGIYNINYSSDGVKYVQDMLSIQGDASLFARM
jgi:hypothetical protein